MNIANIEYNEINRDKIMLLLDQYRINTKTPINVDTYPTGEAFLGSGTQKKHHLLTDIYPD